MITNENTLFSPTQENADPALVETLELDFEYIEDGFFSSEDFDLDAFFSEVHQEVDSADNSATDFLLDLQQETTISVQKITEKVTEKTFNAGVTLTTGVLSALQAIAGACGPLCGHVIGNLAQSAGNMRVPGLQLGNSYSSRSEAEEFVTGLSEKTGLSSSELLSGRYSAEDILMRIMYGLGDGMYACCFGWIDMFFDTFIPSKVQQSNYQRKAA